MQKNCEKKINQFKNKNTEALSSHNKHIRNAILLKKILFPLQHFLKNNDEVGDSLINYKRPHLLDLYLISCP